jgi:hypothetical protein
VGSEWDEAGDAILSFEEVTEATSGEGKEGAEYQDAIDHKRSDSSYERDHARLGELLPGGEFQQGVPGFTPARGDEVATCTPEQGPSTWEGLEAI